MRKEPKVKITITLNSGSVDFFKKHAQENKVKYQTMINEVLDKYVQRYKKRATV
ncbi:BrnA antitoxin family protein [Treponema sp. R80B11-R83G3]